MLRTLHFLRINHFIRCISILWCWMVYTNLNLIRWNICVEKSVRDLREVRDRYTQTAMRWVFFYCFTVFGIYLNRKPHNLSISIFTHSLHAPQRGNQMSPIFFYIPLSTSCIWDRLKKLPSKRNHFSTKWKRNCLFSAIFRFLLLHLNRIEIVFH